jgi:hypothetical protein
MQIRAEHDMNTSTSPKSFTRRQFLHGAGVAVGSLAITRVLRGQEGARAKPSIHVYDDYGWLRGFNVVPSWGARIEQAWWDYHPKRFREEIALARHVHANCIRLWIEFTAWMADPERVTASFLDAVTAIEEAGMKTMPCLFNRWHDANWDYGGTYTENLFRSWGPMLGYVRTLVKPLAGDPRVLCWDLCNEPQAFDTKSPQNAKETEWLAAVAGSVREAGARQPITIGTMFGTNITTFAPLVDVLCGHPYARTRDAMAGAVEALKTLRQQHEKPLLVNECVPGCLDDLKRAEAARYSSDLLSEAGFGWMGWSLKEGRAIATRRDRIDANGIDGQGFHAWFTKEGKLRAGLEFLTEKPKLAPPWETGA